MPTTWMKLKDGSWGLRGDPCNLMPGREVVVSKRDGSTTTAVVGRVLWTAADLALATVAGNGNGNGNARRRPGLRGECTCGACDDLMSFGYRPGQKIRCPECGGWAEAC